MQNSGDIIIDKKGSALMRWRSPFFRRRRLQVVPKLAVPVGREAFALGTRPDENTNVPGHDLEHAGLCLMIVNAGIDPVTVGEIGLMGRFGRPRVVMRDPQVPDGRGWPRRLRAGESVITYFPGELRRHHLLNQMRYVFAQTDDGRTDTGRSPAVSWFIRHLPKVVPSTKPVQQKTTS